MPFPTLSRRARRGLFALAVALPVLALASLAGAAAWVGAHGGLAANLTRMVRHTAFLAGGVESLPSTMSAVQAAALDDGHAGSPCAWTASSGSRAERGFSFALVEPGDGQGVTFDADGRSETLERLKRNATVPTLWFSENGVETVASDRAAVARARELCEPLRRIGREMGRVGGEMGEIGGELGRYGGRLGALGGRLGGVAARLAVARADGAERERLENERDRIHAEMERVRAEMDARERGSLRERREALSDRMEALSKQHREALEQARAGLRQLLHELRGRDRAGRAGRSI